MANPFNTPMGQATKESIEKAMKVPKALDVGYTKTAIEPDEKESYYDVQEPKRSSPSPSPKAAKPETYPATE